MTEKRTRSELPKVEELMRIGDGTRTSRMWKKNGNINTVGKELLERSWVDARQLKHFVRKVRLGKRLAPRRGLGFSVLEVWKRRV